MKFTLLTLLLSLLLFKTEVSAQDKFFTKTGRVHFFSGTPLENIEADNQNVSSVLDAVTGKLEFALLMKAFKFEKALMEEHFNENYVESGKFPKATFSGNITNLNGIDFKKAGNYAVNVAGKLTMHGVTKDVEVPGTLTVAAGNLKAHAVFLVSPEDYKIEIPKLVRGKIAKEIKVTVDMAYQPLNR